MPGAVASLFDGEHSDGWREGRSRVDGDDGGDQVAQIVEHVERVLGIELMCAAQALEFRRPLKSSVRIEEAHEAIRGIVSKLERDRVLSGDIDAMAGAVRSGVLDGWRG